MKKTNKRVIAVVLSLVLAFSVTSAGAYAIATILNGTGSLASVNASTVLDVNSVEDAVELIKNSPELFSGSSSAESTTYNAKDSVIYPTIILPGISQSVSYLADENGDIAVNADGDELKGGLLIIDSSTLPSILLKTLAHPLLTSLVLQKDNGLSEAIYSTVQQVFEIQRSDKNGNPANNLQTLTYNTSVAAMSQSDRDYFYRMVPMQSIKDEVGEDNLYVFAFPLISDPMLSAQKLDDYIQMVKEQKGVDKVNIATISLGGTILTAYLEMMKDNGKGYGDINRVINVVSCLQGTDIMGDFYLRQFNLDDEFLFHDYIPMIMEESNGYGTYGYLINIALKIFPKQVVYSILTAAVDGLLDTLMLNCPQFWAMIPVDRYDDVMAKYSYIQTDPEYAELYQKLTAYHEAAVNLKDNLSNLNAQGIGVNNICGYNLDYSAYDYNFFGIMKSSATTNSDGIIDIDSTSLGATYAKAGTVLEPAYITALTSPDGSIDASTCLFPNNVWFFDGQHHEVGRNDVVIKLVGQLITGEIKSTDDKSDVYPQFNGNRNTKNITRWYLGEAETVFADDASKYDAADLQELHDAYDEAKALLATTICEKTAAEATTDRLLNALRRVGVREEAKDETTDKALEAICKFLDDTLYTVLGPQGFSDATKTHDVPIAYK